MVPNILLHPRATVRSAGEQGVRLTESVRVMEMPSCFLQGFGSCSGKISREHPISEVVLRQLSRGKSATIGGLPWQPSMTLQDIGITALQSKILCTSHNSGLSILDATASTFVATLDCIDKAPTKLAPTTQLDGHLLERWLLKIVSGLVAGQGLGDGIVSDEWKRILVDSPWPDQWGLYIADGAAPKIFAKDIYFATRVHPDTKRVLAVFFDIAGIGIWLLLGRPDDPDAFGVHRPRGLIFNLPEGERRIDFLWPFRTDRAVTYTKLETTKEDPPHRVGWKR